MPDDQNPDRTTDPFAPQAPESSTAPESTPATTPFNTLEEPTVSETTEPQPVGEPAPAEPIAPVTAFTPAPTAVPIAPQPVGDTAGLVPQPPKKSKKGLIIGAIIAGALVLLGGGSALAYNLYYQNPQKVVTDAITSLIKAESMTYAAGLDVTSTSSSDPGSLTVDLNGAATGQQFSMKADISFNYNDQTYTGSIDAVVGEDQKIYVRANDLDKTVADINSALVDTPYAGFDLVELFPNTIETLNNNWVEIDLASLDEEAFREYSETQTCVQGVWTKYEDDASYAKEITDAYKANQFILTPESLGARDINGVASLGYRLDIDDAKLDAFAEEVKGSKLITELTACDESNDFNVDDLKEATETEDGTEVRYELWAARFGHNLTLFTASTETESSKVNFNFSPQIGKTAEITIPTETTSTQEVYDAITIDFQGLYGTSGYDDYSTFETYDDTYVY